MNAMIPKIDPPIPLLISKNDRNFIKKVSIPDELKEILLETESDNKINTVYLELKELEALCTILTLGSLYDNYSEHQEYDSFYQKVQEALGEEEEENIAEKENQLIEYEHHMRETYPEVVEKVDEILENHPLESVDDIMSAIQKVYDSFEFEKPDHSNSPIVEYNGLTHDQLDRLCFSQWDQNPFLRDSSTLPQDELLKTPLIHNTRVFLAEMVEAGGKIKATATNKNLNRRFVYTLLDKFIAIPERDQQTLAITKAVDEHEIYCVHVIRILIEQLKLIRLQQGSYVITKKGKDFLKEDRAAELYQVLMKLYFREFNIAYFDGYKESYALQETMLYTIYSIGKLCEDWQSIESLTPKLILPIVQDELPIEKLPAILKIRIITLLEQFGLVNVKISKEKKLHHAKHKDYMIKKTNLFDEVFCMTF